MADAIRVERLGSIVPVDSASTTATQPLGAAPVDLIFGSMSGRVSTNTRGGSLLDSRTGESLSNSELVDRLFADYARNERGRTRNRHPVSIPQAEESRDLDCLLGDSDLLIAADK
jgi:hypothetical protein